MAEQDKTIEEVKHLLKYHSQAAREFFGDLQTELAERIQLFEKCLNGNPKDLREVREMIALLVASQDQLKERVGDLFYLTDRMLAFVNGSAPSEKN